MPVQPFYDVDDQREALCAICGVRFRLTVEDMQLAILLVLL